MNPQLRARVIAEWRGLAETPFVRHNARPVSEAVWKFMSQIKLDDRLREEQVKLAWKEIAGEFLAKHSSPSALHDGVLIVRVLQPTLLYELDRNLKPQIVAKLRARFGTKTVRDVKFRIG